jgi:homoserine kinase
LSIEKEPDPLPGVTSSFHLQAAPVRIHVPASTSNLGPGFDSFGLALGLGLTVEVAPTGEPFGTFSFAGEGAQELLAAAEENLIFHAMKFAAAREEVELRPAVISVTNEIPLARGLGSSGAAIIAGLSAFEVVTGVELSKEKLLAYATEIEGHSDNIAAALLGSFVVSCVTGDGEVLAARIDWPEEIRVVVAIPDFKLRTEQARAVVPYAISRGDAVFNIQHASLLVAAIAGRKFHLVREAMRDRLHQPYRSPLVPGLEEALGLDDLPGLLGLALSGSGPTIFALAVDNYDRIADEIRRCFESRGVGCAARSLSVAREGRSIIA